MQNMFKFFQNISSNFKIIKKKNNKIDLKNQNQTQASEKKVNGIILF